MSAPLPGRTLADLDGDVLAHCARHLCARDVASLAMACRPLRAAAYCDAVWYRLYRSPPLLPFLLLPIFRLENFNLIRRYIQFFADAVGLFFFAIARCSVD